MASSTRQFCQLCKFLYQRLYLAQKFLPFHSKYRCYHSHQEPRPLARHIPRHKHVLPFPCDLALLM